MKNSKYLPLTATFVVFVLAYVICISVFPNMLSTRVAGNLLTDNAFLGITAVGMTFVILSGGIDLSVGAVIGVTGVLGHIALMRGFRAIDASLVLAFEFSRLPFVVGIGYVMFGELIDMWTWIGAAVVMGSAAYIAHREAKVRREGRR